MSKQDQKPTTAIWGIEEVSKPLDTMELYAGEAAEATVRAGEGRSKSPEETLLGIRALKAMHEASMRFLRDSVSCNSAGTYLDLVRHDRPRVIWSNNDDFYGRLAGNSTPEIMVPERQDVVVPESGEIDALDLAADKLDADVTQWLHRVRDLKEQYLHSTKSSMRNFFRRVHEEKFASAADYLADAQENLLGYLRTMQMEALPHLQPSQRDMLLREADQELADAMFDMYEDAFREVCIDDKLKPEEVSRLRERAGTAFQMFFAHSKDLARA